MKKRLISLAAACGSVFALPGGVVTAHAANINTGAATCIPFSNTPTIAQATSAGMWNPTAASRADLMCSLPRSPLAAGVTAAGFFVDGNAVGANCAITSYDYTGVFLASASFSNTTGAFDAFLSIPAAKASMFAYMYLECSLPPKGRLTGVTSIQ